MDAIDHGLWVSPADEDAPVICDVMNRDGATICPEDEANALLIAAAPDLLGDLKAAVELFERDDECNQPGTDAYTWLYTARATIAKAEGRA